MQNQFDSGKYHELSELLKASYAGEQLSDIESLQITPELLFAISVAEDLNEFMRLADTNIDVSSLDATLLLMAMSSSVKHMVTDELAATTVSENQYDPRKVAILLAGSTIDMQKYLMVTSENLALAMTDKDTPRKRVVASQVASHLFHTFENMVAQDLDDTYLKTTFNLFLNHLQQTAATLDLDDDRRKSKKEALEEKLEIPSRSQEATVAGPFRQAVVRLLALAISQRTDLLPDDIDHAVISELLIDIEWPEDALFEILTVLAHLNDSVITPEYRIQVLSILERATQEYHANPDCLMHADLVAQGLERLVLADSQNSSRKKVITIILNWYRSAQNVIQSANRLPEAPKLESVSTSLQTALEATSVSDQLHAHPQDANDHFVLGANELRTISEIVAFESKPGIVQLITTRHLPETSELYPLLLDLAQSQRRGERSFTQLLKYLQSMHGILSEKIDDKYLWIALFENRVVKSLVSLYTIFSEVYNDNQELFIYDCLDARKPEWVDELSHLENKDKFIKNWWGDRQAPRLEVALTEIESAPSFITDLRPEQVEHVRSSLPKTVVEIAEYSAISGSDLLTRVQDIFIEIMRNDKVPLELRKQVAQWQESILTSDIDPEDLLSILTTNRENLHLTHEVREYFLRGATASQVILAASENLFPIKSAVHTLQFLLHQTIEQEVLPKFKYILQAYFQYCKSKQDLLTQVSSESSSSKNLGANAKFRELCESFGITNDFNELLAIANSKS